MVVLPVQLYTSFGTTCHILYTGDATKFLTMQIDHTIHDKMSAVIGKRPTAKQYEPVHEKTNNLGSDQVQHKPGCAITD